ALPRMLHHKGSGLAYVRIGGKPIYLGRWRSAVAEQEYDRIIREWLANGRQLPATGSETTVAELAAAYKRHAEAYYDSTTTGEYPAVVSALKTLVELYGAASVRDFGPIALKTVRDKWIAASKVRKQINANVRRIVRCFKWGAEGELLPGSQVQ